MLNGNPVVMTASKGTRSVLLATVQGVQGEVALALDSAQLTFCAADEQPFVVLASLVAVPATATSTGYPGQYAVDANYLYYCYAANSWRRVAGLSW